MTAAALGIVGAFLGYVAASGRWQRPAAVLGVEAYRGGTGPVATRPAVEHDDLDVAA